MGRFEVAGLVLQLLFALVAATAWRRDRRQGPLAGYAAYVTAVSVGLTISRMRWPRGPHPVHGLARLRFHVEEWAYLGCTFLFVAVCLHYFVGRRTRAVLWLWAATCLVCLYYPALTGPPLLRLYSIVATSGLVASIACVAWGFFVRRDLEVGVAHLILLLYILNDAALQAVSFSTMFADWNIARAANLALHSAASIAYLSWHVLQARRAR